MKNDFFHYLYMTIRDVRVRDCSAMSLSHLLHGYLSVYAMVRVSPALEREYGTLQEIHGRLREIAKELSKTMKAGRTDRVCGRFDGCLSDIFRYGSFE